MQTFNGPLCAGQLDLLAMRSQPANVVPNNAASCYYNRDQTGVVLQHLGYARLLHRFTSSHA